MEQKTEGCTIERTFGHSIIKWKITDFCFETCREGFLIHSPEFSVDGYYLTKWKMILNTKCKQYGEDCFLVSIERTGYDIAPIYVNVDLKIYILIKEGEECRIPYRSRFAKNDPHKIRLWNILDIRNLLKPSSFNVGVLDVWCHIIVDFDKSIWGGINVIKDNNGLKSLSEDLINLYEVATNYDIILQTDRSDIYAHKAVLCSRSLVLTKLIENECKGMTLDMKHFNYETMHNIIQYFYSGNIEYISKRPSVEMYNYVLHFDLIDLKHFYNAHFLEIESAVEISDQVFLWTVTNFRNRNEDYFVSPIFISDYMDAAWRVSFRVNTMGYIGMHAQVIKGTMPKRGIIHFTIMSNEDALWSKSFRLPEQEKLRIGDEYFIKRKSLECLLEEVTSDDLNIEFVVEIHSEAICPRVTYTLGRSNFPIDRFYQIFSMLFRYVYEAGKFADVIILVGRVSFRVHKAILSARSKEFASMFKEMTGDELVISNIKPSILNIVLYYIYSGVYTDFKLEDVIEVYRAAVQFSIPALKERCSTILQDNLKAESAWDVRMLADEHNDVHLKKSVSDFNNQKTSNIRDKNCVSC